jgi:flagellar biosynthetic protein FliR
MSAEHLTFWLLAFLRSTGLLLLLPAFSGRNIPIPIRVGLAAFLACTVGGYVPMQATLPGDIGSLILISAHEFLVGLLMGLGVRLTFYALEMAGQIISTEIGLVMSSQIDPLSQSQSTPISTALFYFGSLLFLITGAHHAVFVAFVRSFELAPAGGVAGSQNAGDVFVQATGNIFLIALQIAAPLLALNFIITLSFAILGKAAPGINAFSESFGVRIFAGLALLGLTLGLTAQTVLSHLTRAPELMLRLIP